MAILLWITFGIMAGTLINVFRSQEGSLASAMTVGAVGALTGGILGSLLFHYKFTSFSFGTFLVSAFASCLLLYIERVFLRKYR